MYNSNINIKAEKNPWIRADLLKEKSTLHVGCYAKRISASILFSVKKTESFKKFIDDNKDAIKNEFGVDIIHNDKRRNGSDKRGEFYIYFRDINGKDTSRYEEYHAWHFKNLNILKIINERYYKSTAI